MYTPVARRGGATVKKTGYVPIAERNKIDFGAYKDVMPFTPQAGSFGKMAGSTPPTSEYGTLDVLAAGGRGADIISGAIPYALSGSTIPRGFSEQTAQIGKESGLPTGIGTAFGVVAGVLGDPLNLITGGGAGATKLARLLAKTNDVVQVAKLYRDAGFAEDLVKLRSPTLALEKNPDNILKIIERDAKMQSATKLRAYIPVAERVRQVGVGPTTFPVSGERSAVEPLARGQYSIAESFVKSNKMEYAGAYTNPEVGKIDLIKGSENFGMSKIAARHPEILPVLDEAIQNGKVVEKLNKMTIIEGETPIGTVRVLIDHQIGSAEGMVPKTFVNNAYVKTRVLRGGIEPPTHGFSDQRSAIELPKLDKPIIPHKRVNPFGITNVEIDKLAKRVKSQTILKDLEDAQQEISFYEDAIDSMAGKQLMKYISKTTGQLPEITGKETMRSLTGSGAIVKTSDFGRRGDQIIQEIFGYENAPDSAMAQNAVDVYRAAREKLNALKAHATESRKDLNAKAKAARLIELAGGDQRLAFRAVKNAYDLTESELIKLRGGEGMTKQEFQDFLKNASGIGERRAETIAAQGRVEATVAQKNLTKWDNVRAAMQFPPISKMTAEQFDKLNATLKQYKTGDEFLPIRQLETIDRTELTGLKTVREIQEHLAKKYNLTPDQLPGIKPHPWMYDAQLARQHPLYDLLVDKYNVSYLNAGSRIIELEKENSALIKAARASRPQGVGGKIAPTDKNITEWLEAGPESRQGLAKAMTNAELKAAKRMDEVFHEYYDWLSKRSLEGKFESRFEDKYFPHVRRGFLEAWKEDGFLRGLKEQFDQFKQEERMLTILDQKTGDILPYEKWIGFSQFRTGGLVPTQNAARAFKTYITALEKARQFDEFIPEMMIYVHSLSPKGLTARGVELDDSLKRFVKTWINSKKGRVQQQIVKQGSKMDWTLRMGVAFTRLRDLGLNIPVGIANIFGEQAGNLTMLGAKNYSLGVARLATSKGRAITKQYENFIGRTLWDKLTQASNTAGDQLLLGIYGLFGAASRRGNQVFLLGNMTADEFAKGSISVERLGQLRKGQGKYRVVEGAESIIGKSAEAAVAGQYKKWAIPILVSTKDNSMELARIIRQDGVKAALSSKEGSELFYSVLLGGGVSLGVMGYYNELKNKKDRNFVEDLIFKSARDALSMIGALDPKFLASFAAPRLASFFVDLGEAIDNVLFLERYKDGELKGAKQLQTTLTPSVVKQILKETTDSGNKTFKLPELPKLPSLKNSLPALPKLPSL